MVLGFIQLGALSKSPSKWFLVVQVFFELLSFPLIKTLTGVFSCTSGTHWLDDDDTGASSRFCDASISEDAHCMDADPSVTCWTSTEHRVYLLSVVVLLVPYYLACLQLQVTGRARQSIVAIDGAWSDVSTQSKFMLAVIASSFGGCYPIVMVLSVELVVVGQLYMHQTGAVYSSVHSLNGLKVGGLLCAVVNGLYAAFVVYDPAGDPPCAAESGGSGSFGLTVRLVNDYTTTTLH